MGAETSGTAARSRAAAWSAGAAGAIGADHAGAGAVARRLRPAKPYKIGSCSRLSGAAAAGGKTALVGLQMAVDRINKIGGINGRPVELIVADDESKPDVGRRKAEKLVVEDKIDVHVGGFLSNVCLACMPVWEESQDRQHDQRVPRHHAHHHQVQPLQLPRPTTTRRRRRSPSRPISSTRWARSGTSPMPTIPGASRPRDAYADEIKKAGGEVVGTTGIPLGTADMTPFLSKITGDFDGLFGIFFGKDGVTIGNQAFDLGLTKKYKWAGDGAIAESDQSAGARQQDRGLRRHQPLHPGASRARSIRPYHHKFFDEAKTRLARDRSVRAAARPLRAVELRGHERPQARHGEVQVREAARTR